MPAYPQILGVYARNTVADVGAGTTRDSYEQTTYWYVRRTGDDAFEIQPLNANHVPSGLRSVLPKGEFIAAFSPEPSYYERNTLPAIRSLQKKIAEGEEHFALGRLDEAERAFLKALMIDELNVPANLGAGAVYAEKREFQKVKKILGILLNNDETFQLEQRARFNTLGMSLRKQGMLDEALNYYRKALEFDASDENLHFNLARVYFDKGDHVATLEHLEHCLRINPGLEVAQKFQRYCRKQAQAGSLGTGGALR
ncbi:tetratricopeptide repeat protein [Desulfocurvus vexinensis]|uniref:tetratricopeptide repeat protein n=1 Tax=Desulfocurvus vexinensis TaxID=399548 RepID=UPI00048B5AD6|nr:tetratricopeptide repeat protein [Desulfocurvus vexinensis]